MMPSFNIFIVNGSPVEEKKRKRNPIKAALEKKNNEHEEGMMEKLSEISERLKSLPKTAHVGGG